jgi:hypothetical protein
VFSGCYIIKHLNQAKPPRNPDGSGVLNVVFAMRDDAEKVSLNKLPANLC